MKLSRQRRWGQQQKQINLKNRSTGENGILVEVFKCGGKELKQRISNLITNMWENEQMTLV